MEIIKQEQTERIEIPGYPGYFATIKGEIISKKMNRPMRFSLNHKGYPMTVLLNIDNERKTISAHRMICIAYKGYPPSLRSQVNHINGTKTDCRPINLEWVTPEQNQKHSYTVLGRQNRRKSDNLYPNSKLDEIQVQTIRLTLPYLPASMLASYFNVTQRTICNIKNKASWTN